jgi:hypothetical protein
LVQFGGLVSSGTGLMAMLSRQGELHEKINTMVMISFTLIQKIRKRLKIMRPLEKILMFYIQLFIKRNLMLDIRMS